MKRFLKYLLTMLAGFYMLLYILDRIYTYVYQNSLPRNKISYLIAQESQHIDYIFIGSSRVDNTINSTIIEKETGKQALNLGIQAAKPSDYYLILKLLEELDISSDYIFIQIDHVFNLDTNSEILNSYLMPYNNYNTIQDHLKNKMNDYWFIQNIPFYRYLKYDYLIGFREFFSTAIKKPVKIDLSDGFFPKPGYSGAPLKMRLSNVIANNNKYIDSINVFAQNNNQKIIFFTSPYCPDTENIDFIDKLGEKLKVFWDFSRDFESEEYFYDCLHLNENGAIIFSEKIAQKIKSLRKEN